MGRLPYTGLSHAIFVSLNGVFVRHIACSVTASFRANATFAFLGPVGATVQNFVPWRILLGHCEAVFEHDRELAFDGVPFAH